MPSDAPVPLPLLLHHTDPRNQALLPALPAGCGAVLLQPLTLPAGKREQIWALGIWLVPIWAKPVWLCAPASTFGMAAVQLSGSAELVAGLHTPSALLPALVSSPSHALQKTGQNHQNTHAFFLCSVALQSCVGKVL